MTKTVGLIFSCLLLHLQGAVLEIVFRDWESHDTQ
jgi:hypothetical protein